MINCKPRKAIQESVPFISKTNRVIRYAVVMGMSILSLQGCGTLGWRASKPVEPVVCLSLPQALLSPPQKPILLDLNNKNISLADLYENMAINAQRCAETRAQVNAIILWNEQK